MNTYLKLALTLSLFSGAALFAQPVAAEYNEFNNCCPNSCVYLANPNYCFDADVRVLYFQPYASNLHYVAEAEPLPLPSPSWVINDIRPDYHFAFELGGSMAMPERNAKAFINWTHFYSKDSNSFVAGANDMVGPFFEIGPDAAAYTNAHGRATFHYDSVNVDYGVLVNFGDYLKTTIFGGVGFASIDQHLQSTYSNADGTISRTITSPSKFWGAGPQVGLDFTYDVYEGISVKGCGTASVLVGSLKNHTSYDSTSPFLAGLGITPPNAQSTTVHTRTQLVPAFEGKLGLGYTLDVSGYALNFEAGYEARVYINAIQSVDMGSEVVTPPVVPDTVGVFARTFQRTVSNFAVAGPYLSVNVGF